MLSTSDAEKAFALRETPPYPAVRVSSSELSDIVVCLADPQPVNIIIPAMAAITLNEKEFIALCFVLQSYEFLLVNHFRKVM